MADQPTFVAQESPSTNLNPPPEPTGVWPPPAPPTGPPPQPLPAAEPPESPLIETSTWKSDGPGIGSLGGLLEGGWKGLTTNVGDWIVNFVVMFGVIGVVVALFAAYDWIITDTTGQSGGFAFETKHPIRPLEIALILVLFTAVVFILYGFDQAALKVARGERPIVNDVWAPSRFLPYLAMQTIFLSVSIFAWFIPFVGPAVAWGALLYAPYFVLDRRGSGVTALFRSITTATRPGHFGRQVLFGFFLSLTAYVSFGFLGIGLYVVYSAGAEVWSQQWRTLTGLLLLALWGTTFLISIACARTAAALGYERLTTGARSEGFD